MIETFEDITYELTDDELNIVPKIVDRFKKWPGKKYIVSNKQMISGIQRSYQITLSEPRIRKIIQYIRINNILPGLLATSKGYYLSNNPDEIKTWIETMLQREKAIAQSRIVAQNHLKMLINGNQINLFNEIQG